MFLTVFITLLCRSSFADAGRLVELASPLQGTDSSFDFSYGNTYPAIARPFPMNVWTPYTQIADSFFYQYSSRKIRGFKQTHQPSPHMGDYGAFGFMPVSGSPVFSEAERSSDFKHERERARPSYYSVHLDTWDIDTELTATERAASVRVTFNKRGPSHIVFDGFEGQALFHVDTAKRVLAGYVTNNSGGVPQGFASHFVVQFDQPIVAHRYWTGGGSAGTPQSISGRRVGAIVSFDTSRSPQVTFRVASSFIDAEQARRNLDVEIGRKSFDQVLAASDDAWDRLLGRVALKGASEEQARTFYSALYRSVLFPQVFHEPSRDGGFRYFSPYDGKLHQGVMMTNSGYWDTFRAVHPLFNLLFPEVSSHVVKGILAAYDQSGFLPAWSSPGHRPIMIGNHAFSLIADAVAKGVPGIDSKRAAAAVVHDAHTEAPKAMRTTGRQGAEFFDALGYVPSPDVGESVSKTLEYAYDDFCAAVVVAAAGDKQGATGFLRSSRNYKNVFDSVNLFMRGKSIEGAWHEPFDPYDWGGRYTEGNAWQWNWSVFHDIRGLIRLFGGDAAFASALDTFFSLPPVVKVGAYKRLIHEMSEMMASNMGQYAHGNQPDQHVPYLYNYIGQPWKTQAKVREIVAKLYNSGPRGLCGDEDTGQTSAWYVFSALGFYPVTPGHPSYVIGSPLFPEATLHLPNGKTFVIRALGNEPTSPYIDSAKLNGEAFSRTFLSHDELTKGGELEFVMKGSPNKAWATAPMARPFSTGDLGRGDFSALPSNF